MSGIYIPGVEMPTTCAKCPLGHINAKRYAIECFAEYHTTPIDYDIARHSTNPFCPLIPVPDHGRLMDADDMILNWRNEINTLNERGVVYADGYWDEIIERFIQDAVTATTIIPADHEEGVTE